MGAPFFQIDAFADRPLAGGPAAVLRLPDFPPAALMQAVAAENNLPETAYVAPGGGPGAYRLRWFTPAVEVPLCGHATLAAAHALMAELEEVAGEARFATASGELVVRRLADGRYEMDFPARPPRPVAPMPELAAALGAEPVELHAAQFLLAIFATADEVRALAPDFAALRRVGGPATQGAGNVICAARGDEGYDVVSRFFAPGSGIDEDPATGSAHCVLAPFYSARLGKTTLRCRQAYPGRGADIDCALAGDRVRLLGHARTVVRGEFELPA